MARTSKPRPGDKPTVRPVSPTHRETPTPQINTTTPTTSTPPPSLYQRRRKRPNVGGCNSCNKRQ